MLSVPQHCLLSSCRCYKKLKQELKIWYRRLEYTLIHYLFEIQKQIGNVKMTTTFFLYLVCYSHTKLDTNLLITKLHVMLPTRPRYDDKYPSYCKKCYFETLVSQEMCKPKYLVQQSRASYMYYTFETLKVRDLHQQIECRLFNVQVFKKKDWES